MTWQPQVTAELYDTDATTSLGFLWPAVAPGATSYRGAFDIKWLDEKNGVGSASFKLGVEHPLSGSVTDGRFVAFYIGATRCYTMVVEGDPAYVESHPDDGEPQVMDVKGRNWLATLDAALVKPHPTFGFTLPFANGYRVWSFASEDFPNAGGWAPVVELYEYFDGVTVVPTRRVQAIEQGDPPVLMLYPSPVSWPWANAPKNGNGFAPTAVYDPTFWVDADGAAEEDVGFRFARGGFGLAGPQTLTVFVTADNLFMLFLDGVPILTEEDDTLVWMGWKQVSFTLPAGFHTVGAMWENIDAPDLAFNPCGLLLAFVATSVYPGDVETSLTLSLLTSTAADLVESYYAADGTWPGWSVGQILGTWIPEVQAQGLIAAYDTGAETYDGNVDSEGETWASPIDSLQFIPLFAMEIGRSGLDLLAKLVQTGWCDWHGRADVLALDVWNQATAGVDSGVTLQFGPVGVGNIAAPIQRGIARSYADRLIVQFGQGQFTQVDDVPAQTARGTVTEQMYSVDSPSEADAVRDGQVELGRRAVTGRPAVKVEVIPTSAADAPYEAFGVADRVTLPAEAGGTVLQQVLSIGVRQRKDGTPEYQCEINERRLSRAVDSLALFRALGGKNFGSAGEGTRRVR